MTQKRFVGCIWRCRGIQSALRARAVASCRRRPQEIRPEQDDLREIVLFSANVLFWASDGPALGARKRVGGAHPQTSGCLGLALTEQFLQFSKVGLGRRTGATAEPKA